MAVEKYHMRRDDSGEVYVRSCDIHFLEERKIGDGEIDIGTQFRCVSKIDGSEYTETLIGVGKKGLAKGTRTWIMRCDSMGVSPDQINEAMAADDKLGIHVEYDRNTGQAIYRSPGQFKRHAELHGFHSNGKKGGGYSSPQSYSQEERERRGLPPMAYEVEAYE